MCDKSSSIDTVTVYLSRTQHSLTFYQSILEKKILLPFHFVWDFLAVRTFRATSQWEGLFFCIGVALCHKCCLCDNHEWTYWPLHYQTSLPVVYVLLEWGQQSNVIYWRQTALWPLDCLPLCDKWSGLLLSQINSFWGFLFTNAHLLISHSVNQLI